MNAPLFGHLGARASALLDGQLSPEETARAWHHVHGCHQCRDEVERAAWVKSRLAGLSGGPVGAPDHLKGSLLQPPPSAFAYPEDPAADGRVARRAGLAALSGGAVGAAVMGVLALGTAPADAPGLDRRMPTSSVPTPSSVNPGTGREP